MIPTVITIGTFDGVHRGHHEVIRKLKELARSLEATPVVVTFDRHPLEVVAPLRAPKMIMSTHERDRLLADTGVKVIDLEFNDRLRSQTALQWMRRLKDEYGAVAIVVGYDNKFGCDGRNLSYEDFRRLGQELLLRVEVAQEVEGCSSTAVRSAVMNGDVESAAGILGRPFSVSGEVVKGRQLGRTIGFPTANVEVSDRQLLPKTGVYAAEARINSGTYRAMVNVGYNPTVSAAEKVGVEAHLIDFDGEIYGQPIKIDFLKRLRDEKKFTSLEALKSQLKQDRVNASGLKQPEDKQIANLYPIPLNS